MSPHIDVWLSVADPLDHSPSLHSFEKVNQFQLPVRKRYIPY